MPTQTGSIDFTSAGGLKSYAAGQFATQGTVTDMQTQISQNANDITLRATKTEVQQVRPAYASSSTAAGTAAKVATIDPAVTGYALYKGASVAVTFSTANTAATPTLNLNSTGAKQIRSYTGAALSEAEYKWAAGATIDLVYDGTYWRMQDGGSVKRVTAAEASIKVNADNINLKVSKNDVINQINVSTEGAKIQASKVEIDGTAVFSAISSDVDDAITEKGYQTSSQVESAITSKGYQTSSQVESAITSKGYQTASQVSTAVTNGTANLATKANAVKRTQRIWYRKSASGAPATPGTASSNWVTKADDGNDAWTKMHIAISSTHKYIYTCEQYEMANGTVGYTSVLLDNTITVIDGGNIITGTVTANKLNAADINASKTLTVGAMTDAAASTILNSNVVVGGRNLLRGSQTQDTGLGNNREEVTETEDTWLGCKVFKSSIAWADIGFRFDLQVVNRGLVEVGDVLTYSIWAKTDDTVSRDIYGIWVSNKAGGTHMNGAKIATLTSKWTRYEKQITVTQAMLDAATVGTNTRFECNTACTDGKYIYWAAPKLEKGNKATDWTPAPEDTQESIDTSVGEVNASLVATEDSLSQQIQDTNNGLSSVSATVTQLNETVQKDRADIGRWLNFNESDGLTIGKAGSQFKVVTDETRQAFMYGNETLAYTSGDRFVAPRMEADELHIGNWMWVKRDNGNLSLKWIG